MLSPMGTLVLILLAVAAVLFVLAAFGVEVGRISHVALGLACVAAALLVERL